MNEALAKAIQGNDPQVTTFLTGFYVIAEYTDDEGRRWLTRFTDEDSTMWSRMGMLAFAQNEELLGAADVPDEADDE